MTIHTVYHLHKTLGWRKIELPVWQNSWGRGADESLESPIGVLLVVSKYFLFLFIKISLL